MGHGDAATEINYLAVPGSSFLRDRTLKLGFVSLTRNRSQLYLKSSGA